MSQIGQKLSNHAQWSGALADPGDAGTIQLEPDNNYCTCSITTSGAETRTLADPPDHAGFRLTISMDTDGGDCTITADTAINEAGNTIITLDDAGETISLESITIGGSGVWRVTGNDSATLS